jgi:Uma2 family endonuclease
MKGAVARRLLTRDDFHRMGAAGILTEDDRVELVNGELIEMTPIGPRHAAAVRRLDRLFTRRLDRLAVISVQNPVALGEYSEPQPDLGILRPRADEYRTEHPAPRDIFLLVEVMDSSGDFDRGEKLQSYARASIQEVWLLDLAGELLEVHLQPAGTRYRSAAQFKRGQRVQIAALPGKWFRVTEILG